MRMSPEVGASSPTIMFSVVDLPQPDGPSNAMVSPSSQARDMSSTAMSSPNSLRSSTSSSLMFAIVPR